MYIHSINKSFKILQIQLLKVPSLVLGIIFFSQTKWVRFIKSKAAAVESKALWCYRGRQSTRFRRPLTTNNKLFFNYLTDAIKSFCKWNLDHQIPLLFVEWQKLNYSEDLNESDNDNQDEFIYYMLVGTGLNGAQICTVGTFRISVIDSPFVTISLIIILWCIVTINCTRNYHMIGWPMTILI